MESVENRCKLAFLVALIFLALHSLFPPRLYEGGEISAGRKLVLSGNFYKADYIRWKDSFMENETALAEYHSRKRSSIVGPKTISASWNPTVFDLGRFISEALLILSLAGIFHLCLVRNRTERQSEQSVPPKSDRAGG